MEMEMEHERPLDPLTSSGMIGDEKLVCQYIENAENKGVWRGDNPLHHNISVLLVQIVLIFIVSRITHFLLRPFHQTLLAAQIVAGIIMGPLFGHSPSYAMLFPTASGMTLTTFAEFGIIVYFFKMGVQVNPKQFLKIEKHAVVIGIVGYMSSMVLGIAVLSIVGRITNLAPEKFGGRALVIMGAVTPFSVISSLLREMNILNSEIGRMALSTSTVSDACMFVFFFVTVNGVKALGHRSTYKPFLQLVASFCYFAIIFFLLRPLVIWISNRNPQRKPMTESHFISIICILLFVGLSAQFIGQPSFLVAFLFGWVLPDGPPLGSTLAERLDTVGSTLIVPAFCIISGLRTSVSHLGESRSASIEVILIAGYVGKFVGTILPSLYFQIEFWDSFALALIMCCKGLMDLSVLNVLLNSKAIDEVSFTLALYTMVVVTGFATLGVYYIYDPSRRYRTYMKRSITDSEMDLELKVLVCVHNEENVYPMINLLQATNPTNTTPLSVFVLHLMELSGRAASILTKNEYTNKSSSCKETPSQHISNAFDQFQLHNKGCVTLHCFTVIAPFASMHDDICYMAMDTKSHIVFVPFHRQWSMDGNVEVSNASIRTLNQKILNNAPCSIGVLIDRSQVSGKLLVIYEKSFCEIAVIFLGGADDQEALACGRRIAQHPNVKLTVFWIRVKIQDIKQRNVKNPYIDLMEHVRYSSNLKGKVTFKEKIVEDGTGTTRVIRTMEGHFGLVIVGRHHIAGSPCTLGLTEWCELPELGPVGNLLATSDFTFSVLVVQQQPPLNYDFRYLW